MTRPYLQLHCVVPAVTAVLLGLGLLVGSELVDHGIPSPLGVALAVISAGVAPVIWLIRQTSVYRRRSDDERRIWQTFAEATRELNRLEPADAAVAGVAGALRLFPAYRAQLLVNFADGRKRSYCGEPGGPVKECDCDELDNDPNLAIRTLLVGGVHVGELRLRLRPPLRLRNRDLLMFAAYGDALAAALHDAATHHELREMTARTNHDAVHDALTGLPNRGGFVDRGEAALRELPAPLPVALLLFDLDRFREVNDTLGHAAGDELLNIATGRLMSTLGPTELPGRLGGDEFAVLLTALPGDAPAANGGTRPNGSSLPDTAPGANALSGVSAIGPADLAGSEHPCQLAYVLGLARRMAEGLAMPSEVAGVQLSVEASVGVVVAPAGSADLIELLRRADVAMYQAKRGGSSVAWYDASRDPASTDRLALLAEMREALADDDQLVLMLQPAVGLAGGGATGAEALVRWLHPRRGTLEPAEFVKIVEHSELIRPFTRYVLDRALAIAADWARAGVDLPIAVNLTPRSLLDRRLPEDVQGLLDRHRVRPDRLVLEITETVVTTESTMIDDVLRQLRGKGVQLAVDDFGTGYSSLTFLARVPVDEVKVDPSFVRRMIDSPEAAAIVRTTVDLGRRLGIRVVAEGVETPEQLATLTTLGATAAQGYQLHPPLSPDRALEVLLKLGKAKLRLLREEAS